MIHGWACDSIALLGRTAHSEYGDLVLVAWANVERLSLEHAVTMAEGRTRQELRVPSALPSRATPSHSRPGSRCAQARRGAAQAASKAPGNYSDALAPVTAQASVHARVLPAAVPSRGPRRRTFFLSVDARQAAAR